MGDTEDSTDAMIARALAKNAQLRRSQTPASPPIKKEVKFECPHLRRTSVFPSHTITAPSSTHSPVYESIETSSVDSASPPASPTPTTSRRSSAHSSDFAPHPVYPRSATVFGLREWKIPAYDNSIAQLGYYMFSDEISAARAKKQMGAVKLSSAAQHVWEYRVNLAMHDPSKLDTIHDPTRGISMQCMMGKKDEEESLTGLEDSLGGVSLGSSSSKGKDKVKIKQENSEGIGKDRRKRSSTTYSSF